jgi:hypothetical protein
MPAATIATWLSPVAAALDYLHERGYVHGDVRPSTVRFDAKGEPYLCGPGPGALLAESSGVSLTEASVLLAAPEYLAPEWVMGRPLDGRVDQYALALTVYEMLCGRHPFEGSTPTAVLVRQTVQTPRPLHEICPAIPAQLSAVVQRALSKEPEQRFPDCATFAQAFASAVENPVGSAAGPLAWVRRPESGQAGLAAAVVGLAAVVTVSRVTRRARRPRTNRAGATAAPIKKDLQEPTLISEPDPDTEEIPVSEFWTSETTELSEADAIAIVDQMPQAARQSGLVLVRVDPPCATAIRPMRWTGPTQPAQPIGEAVLSITWTSRWGSTDDETPGGEDHGSSRAPAIAERRRWLLPGTASRRGSLLPRASLQRPARPARAEVRLARSAGSEVVRWPGR